MNRQLIRRGVAAVIVLDLLAVAAFSVRVTHTTTTRTPRLAPVALPAPSIAATSSSPSPTASSSPIAPPAVVVVAAAPTASAVPATSSTPSAPSSGSPSTPPPTSPTVAACPIPLATPVQTGGLQSLISFSPAFGAFSAEAFAAASAYQPLLQLIGPILAEYPTMTAGFANAFTPFISAIGNLMTSLFGAIEPYYKPYRTKLLQAETQLANFFAPYAEKLANSPLGGCVVDLEAALVGDTTSSISTVEGR